jgi:anti-sigma factor RsiW
MTAACPELDVLFADLAEGQGPALEHSKTCPACSAVLAEHRELEQELFRLHDPFPPSSFVPQVMARVAAAPVPPSVEVRTGLTILGTAVMLAITVLAARGGNASNLGVAVAHAMVEARAILIGLFGGMSAAWRTAAVPLSATLTVLLVLSLVALKKLAGTDVPAKV